MVWTPLPEKQTQLCIEIERLGKKVWQCKLYYKVNGTRCTTFARTQVEGPRTEAHRVMQIVYDLELIKQEGGRDG